MHETHSSGLDGWTEHFVVPFAKRPTNAQGSSGCFINTFQMFYPDMFRHMITILRGSWVLDKLLKQCSVLWACADYDLSRVTSFRGHSTTYMPKHVGVENLERINKTSTSSLSICWSFCKPFFRCLHSNLRIADILPSAKSVYHGCLVWPLWIHQYKWPQSILSHQWPLLCYTGTVFTVGTCIGWSICV
jgi:hypothetical protein